MTMAQHAGSCLCGAVTFEVHGGFERFFLCHCSRCRKDTGSAHAANLFSSTARLDWLSGQEKVRTYRLPQSRHARSFCSVCGSALPIVEEGFIVVPAGSLDSELAITPDAHIFAASRASWDRNLSGMAAFDALPP
jgi:hypothetical protein